MRSSPETLTRERTVSTKVINHYRGARRAQAPCTVVGDKDDYQYHGAGDMDIHIVWGEFVGENLNQNDCLVVFTVFFLFFSVGA